MRRRWIRSSGGDFYRDVPCIVADMKGTERHWWWLWWNPYFWRRLRILDEEWNRIGRGEPERKRWLDPGDHEWKAV